MITVHHLENSRSQRVLWLLEELGLDYEVVKYKRDPETLLAPPELRAIHPLGKSPVVVDGDDVLAESGAIIEALVERHDAAHVLAPPPGSRERLRWRYWLHYAEGSAMPPLLLSLVFSRVAESPMPFFARPVARGIAGKALAGFVRPQLKLHAGYLEGELANADWFCGAGFSAADIQMSFPVEALEARLGFDAHPRLRDWLQRIHARPAWVRAMDRGGPYALVS
ncbi:glutathione S-transferase [Luteimonas soli]|uniref:Glutathione S-transferase n=1 Tax=Luteimonas soli TaxID=1648966 RepID=A0ABV7XP71_9GAMM